MDIIVNQHARDIKLYAISTLYKQTNKSQGTDAIASMNALSNQYNGFFDDESVLGYLFKLRTIKDQLIAFDCTDDHFYERSRQDMIDIIRAEPKKIKSKQKKTSLLQANRRVIKSWQQQKCLFKFKKGNP